MKLTELMGVKRYKDKTPDEVAMDASWYGFERIGRGAHAMAFLKDDLVYKFWAQDDSYADFVVFCQTHKSKFLPVFKSPVKTVPTFFLKAPGLPSKISYVKMEKLEEIDWGAELQLTNDVSVSLFDLIEAVAGDGMHAKTFDKNLKKFLKGRPAKLEHFNSDAREFIDLLRSLVNIANKKGYEIDLHEENVMQRGNTPVIIDPFVTDDIAVNSKWEKHYSDMLTKKREPRKGI